MQTIAPCLFFDGKAENAVNLYKSVFKSAKVGHILQRTTWMRA